MFQIVFIYILHITEIHNNLFENNHMCKLRLFYKSKLKLVVNNKSRFLIIKTFIKI